MRELYNNLISYSNSDYYGFHMPGHKRNTQTVNAELPYKIDITEIEGFDDLHHPRGILLQAQKRAAEVYGAEETYFLINGSTVGILSAILGCTRKGDKVLVARNCHKSVYNAIELNELRPVYLYTDFYGDIGLNGQVKGKDVKAALEKERNISAIILTSPTYDGIVSDIKEIARIVHEYGIPLIVDEAHGAHFGFHPDFPQNANVLGADVVIHSLHKTLPALTQTALLHINGDIVDRDEIKRYLDVFQTSSPSYVLMASIDACVAFLEKSGRESFSLYVKNLRKLRQKLKNLTRIQLIETEKFDISKLVLSVLGTEWTGKQLYEILLQKYHLQMEMAAGTYVIAMTSVGDTEGGFDRLFEALREIDGEMEKISEQTQKRPWKDRECNRLERVDLRTECVCSAAEMRERIRKERAGGGKHLKRMPWENAAGRISTEYIYLYPPGVPLIVPGERIPEGVSIFVEKYMKMGFYIEGIKTAGEIEVWIDG